MAPFLWRALVPLALARAPRWAPVAARLLRPGGDRLDIFAVLCIARPERRCTGRTSRSCLVLPVSISWLRLEKPAAGRYASETFFFVLLNRTRSVCLFAVRGAMNPASNFKNEYSRVCTLK